MEEAGSIAKRERANQELPVTIGSIAGMAPDVEDAYMIQDFGASEAREQVAQEKGPTSDMPDASKNVVDSMKGGMDAVSEGASEAKEAVSGGATEAKEAVSGRASEAKDSASGAAHDAKEKASDATDQVKEASKADYNH